MIPLLLACTGELEDPGAPGITTELSVDDRIVLVVEAPGADDLLAERVEGLELEVRQLDAHRWELTYTGPPGSYVLPGPLLSIDGEATTTPTHYVDLGVEGPSSQLEPLAALPPPPERPLWPWFLGLAVAGFLSGAAITGVLVWRNRDLSEPLPPPVPPDVEALKAWADAQGLDDHALALELSRIFRRYVERVTGQPASAMTSFEVLEVLDERFDREMSKRLLTATDLIKFAREQGSAELFAELGGGLRQIVIATRPPPEIE